MKIGKTLYFDHQATTPINSEVLAEMMPYLDVRFGNPHSSDHCLGWEAARAIEVATAQVARLIGAEEDEIIFTSGATESNNLALLGLGRRSVGGKRRRILLSAIEHKSVLALGRVLEEQYGFIVEPIPVNKAGIVEPSALRDALDDDVLTVSVMAVNNEIGTIQQVLEIATLCRQHGAIFHCDAAQAPMAMDISKFAMHVHMLSLSSHKMYGPKGVGAIFISRDLQTRIEPLVYGGGQQNGLRSGTVPVALCVGMGAAARKLTCVCSQRRREELRSRRDTFVRKLKRLDWPVSVNGANGAYRHPGNANVRFLGFSAQDILAALQPRLAASTGSACTSGVPEPSHVLRAIGLDYHDANSCIRFSLGYDTTDDDVDEAVALVEEALTRLSKAGLGAREL